MSEQVNYSIRESLVLFYERSSEKYLDYAKRSLERAMKQREKMQDYIQQTKEIIHHEKYLSTIKGDDQDLRDARKRLQKAKNELKKLDAYCLRLNNQIKYQGRTQQKAQKKAKS